MSETISLLITGPVASGKSTVIARILEVYAALGCRIVCDDVYAAYIRDHGNSGLAKQITVRDVRADLKRFGENALNFSAVRDLREVYKDSVAATSANTFSVFMPPCTRIVEWATETDHVPLNVSIRSETHLHLRERAGYLTRPRDMFFVRSPSSLPAVTNTALLPSTLPTVHPAVIAAAVFRSRLGHPTDDEGYADV